MDQLFYSLQAAWDWMMAWWNGLREGAQDNIIGTIVGTAFVGTLLVFRDAILTGITRLFRKPPPLPPPMPPVEPQKVVIELKPSPTPVVEPPPARAATPVPVRLPSTAVDFVTRRDKDGRDLMEVLKEELSPQRNQVVTLWGPGGVGKTALATEAFRVLTPQFPQRVWTTADGRPDFSLSTLLDAIATQLGQEDLRRLNEQAKAEEVQRLVATTPTLLTLDNFETVSSAEKIRCAEWLTQFAPCPALITSRNPVERARSLSIHAMSQPEAQELLTRLINNTPQPHVFAGVDRDELIRVAEGNPLVLEWIVAQMRQAQTASTVLMELTQGQGEIARRVFQRSFNLPEVGEDGRTILLALSLFVPDASREALAAVVGLDSDVARLNAALKPLADLRLLETTADNQRLLVQGLTRELAKAQLEKDSRAADFHPWFVSYFVEYARAHIQPTPENLGALEAEKDNLIQALEIAVASQKWQIVMGIAAAIAGPVGGMLGMRGYWVEALRSNNRALNAARQLNDQAATALFANATAITYHGRGDWIEAKRLYEESLAINKQLGNQAGIASTLQNLGWLAKDQGELTEAKRLYEESLAINKQLGNQRGIASTEWGLGSISLDQGNLKEAEERFHSARDTFAKLGDQRNLAGILHQLGGLMEDQGELAKAKRLYEESLTISKQLGNQEWIAKTQGQLGLLAEQEGNKTEAVRHLRLALEIFEKLKSPDAEMARKDLARVEEKGK